jgi:hypothetical protein
MPSPHCRSEELQETVMIALSLFTRLCAVVRQIGSALRGGYARSPLRATSALSRVMEGGGAGA